MFQLPAPMRRGGCKRDVLPERRKVAQADSAQLHRHLRYGDLPQHYLDPVPRIHAQPRYPSSVGESIAAIAEAALPPALPSLSGVTLWMHGRQKDGLLHDLSASVFPRLVIDALREYGVVRYSEIEEYNDDLATLPPDPRSIPLVASSLAISPTAPDLHETICRALWSGFGIQICGPVRALYLQRGHSQEPAGLGELASDSDRDGHAQRICGWTWHEGRRVYVIQNSWGSGWGGCVVEGQPMPGCCLAQLEVASAAWEINAVAVKERSPGLRNMWSL